MNEELLEQPIDIKPIDTKPIEAKPIDPIALDEIRLVKINANTVTKYQVVQEKIDLGDLVIEKRGIEQQLARNMDDATLLAWARANYPEFNTDYLRKRLDEINQLLEII